MDGIQYPANFDAEQVIPDEAAALNPNPAKHKPAPQTPRDLDVRWAFPAVFLVFEASLANLLAYHQYPFFRMEVLILSAIAAGIAGLYWALYRKCRPLTRRLLEALLIYLALDLNTDSSLAAATMAVAVPLIGHRIKVTFLPLITVMSIGVLVSALVGLADFKPAIAREAGSPRPTGKGPAILHVILDEHGGLPSIEDTAVRASLADVYSRNNFRLFSHAYSRHFRTVNAVPDVLNFGTAGESRKEGKALYVGRTAYLSSLNQSGYRLHLYQSEFADFCRYAKAASCTNYWSPSLAFVDAVDAPATEKARLIAYKLIVLSGALMVGANMYDQLAHKDALDPLNLPWINLKLGGHSTTLGGFAALDRLTKDVRTAQPGEVYFAHLLAPHFPYLVSRDCVVLPPSRWHFRHSPLPIEARKAGSNEQLMCLAKRLDQLFTAFRKSSAGRDGIIIIHGDHGSRITEKDPSMINRTTLSPTDLVQGYSTLFAVSLPGSRASVDDRPVTTADVLKTLHRNRFQSFDGLQQGDGRVFLEGPLWSVGDSVALPKAWSAPN